MYDCEKKDSSKLNTGNVKIKQIGKFRHLILRIKDNRICDTEIQKLRQ